MSTRSWQLFGSFTGVGDTPPARSDTEPLDLPRGSEAPPYWRREELRTAVGVFGGLLAVEGGLLPWGTGGGVFVAYFFVAVVVFFVSGVADVAGWPAIAVATGLDGVAALLLIAGLGLAGPSPEAISRLTTGLIVGGSVLAAGAFSRRAQLERLDPP